MTDGPDPDRYARMCEPFPAQADAEAAWAAFFAEVEAARERHRIANVVVCGGMFAGDRANPTFVMTMGCCGATSAVVPILRRMLKAVSKDHNAAMDEAALRAAYPREERTKTETKDGGE